MNPEIISSVHIIDSSWSQIELSLILAYEKLVEFGFIEQDGQTVIIDPETERSERYVHLF